MTKELPRFWVVRADSGKFTSYFLEYDFVGIGWIEIGNVVGLSESDIRKKHTEIYSGTTMQMTASVSQLVRFIHEIAVDDYVLTPNYITSTYAVGKVVSGPFWNETEDGCRYNIRRKIEWDCEFKKSDVKYPLKAALNAGLTIFNLDKYRQTLERLINPEAYLPRKTKKKPKPIEDIYPSLVNKFYEMEPEEFEGFITDLLQTIGFVAEKTSYTKDGGKDIVGDLNISEIMEIPVKVQVKRQKANIGPDLINSLRGILKQDEFGIFVTSSSFTNAAKSSSSSEGLKTIWLVDGSELCRLILENFDQLDEEVTSKLGLERVFKVYD